MSREERVVVRCTAAEKKLLGEVAFAMQRTLSDAVRILVFEKARALEILIPAPVEGTVPLHIHSIVDAQLLTRTHSGGER
jgi:hypothetical protein